MHMHSRWMVSKNHQLLTIWCTHAVGHHQVCQLIYQGETQCFSKIDLTQWKIRLQQQLIQDLKVNSWILWQNTSGLSNLQSKNYFSTRWLIQFFFYRHRIHGKSASGQVDYNLKNVYRELTDKERIRIKVTVFGVSNMLENISIALKKKLK